MSFGSSGCSDEENDDVASLLTQMRNLRLNSISNNESNRNNNRNQNRNRRRRRRRDDWETTTVTSSLYSLQRKNGRKNVSLERLDRQLQTLHDTMGISLTKMRKIIKRKGICLKNCVEYGSMNALKQKLRSNRRLIVSKNQAKQFKYVKSCLVMIDQ